jgi:hypothetical protein
MDSAITGVIPGSIVGAVAVGGAYLASRGIQLPVLSSPRAAFWAVAIVGMVACAPGLNSVLTAGGSGAMSWVSPAAVAGSVLGVAGLALMASVAFGFRLPYVANDTQALVALGAIVALKVVIALGNGAVLAATR